MRIAALLILTLALTGCTQKTIESDRISKLENRLDALERENARILQGISNLNHYIERVDYLSAKRVLSPQEQQKEDARRKEFEAFLNSTPPTK